MVARNRGVPFTIEERDRDGKYERKKMVQEESFEEEWSRREEELIERMSKIVVDSKKEGSTLPFKRRSSFDYIPPSCKFYLKEKTFQYIKMSRFLHVLSTKLK
uniref:Uncharacterized protein n=1 Tax=Anguilla anguilla TaxID=7936 RepID=A0A0E9WEL7_ANGAN